MVCQAPHSPAYCDVVRSIQEEIEAEPEPMNDQLQQEDECMVVQAFCDEEFDSDIDEDDKIQKVNKN